MSSLLQFGIPSFDALFGRPNPSTVYERSYEYNAYGIQLSDDHKNHKTTSLCFIGPDGSGKSVFGLHLAAQYMSEVCLTRTSGANSRPWYPRVLYVSTDLKHHVAEVMWKNFGLDKPNEREFPFYWGYRLAHPNSPREVMLARLDPGEIPSAVLADNPDPLKADVHFIDLVSKTMGDDWSFINRLLAVLRTPAEGCAPHLLVIDAVEGFETLVGERDAFGEVTSRRARIAQIMRTAGDKCHVCFIVEEPKTDERFPEEFVTDVVVRLRSVNTKNYARRTIEIVKARGQSHVRGQHPFVVRNSDGSTSGQQENADDPSTRNSYVHVYPSLHYLSRAEMKSRGPANPEPETRVAAFGITYLDEMLARLVHNVPVGLDDQGLKAQTTTALIGEIATQKTSLATAFLGRTFRAFAFELAGVIRELRNPKRDCPMVREALAVRLSVARVIRGETNEIDLARVVDRLVESIRKRNTPQLNEELAKRHLKGAPDAAYEGSKLITFAAWLAEALVDNGAAVLVTTSDQDRDRLVREFELWLKNSKSKALQDWPRGRSAIELGEDEEDFHLAIRAHMIERTICRRLELHDLSSAILIQIIQRCVERAQERVFLSKGLDINVDRLPYFRKTRFERSFNVRVVIDDLSTLKDTYPDIGADPLFLPFLLSYLELEGVTSLIIDSQIGRPDAEVRDAFDRELRALVPHKLLTWRVPFYGGIRDAITLVPPYPSGLRSVVREVRWESKQDAPKNALLVDPELELYSGLERGEPKPIPLEVRLYAETAAFGDYIQEENEIFGQLFTPLGGNSGPARVIVGVETGQYDALRDLCNVQTDTLLNHTMVFQVDEFWSTNRSPLRQVATFPRGPVARREGALYPLGPYLVEQTCTAMKSGTIIDRITDPFGVFQGEPAVVVEQEPRQKWQRRHYFTRSSQGLSGQLTADQVARIDRVPFTWDFGFLLCPKSVWDIAGGRSIGYKDYTVKRVWDNLPKVRARDSKEIISWRAFLSACKTVAQSQAERTAQPVRVLDVSTLAPESFLCLVLEMWASEIFDLPGLDRAAFFKSFSEVSWGSQGTNGLIDWLQNRESLLCFYKVWLLLADSLTLSDMVDRQPIPRLKIRDADGSAAATRHWYKTASGRRQQSPLTGEFGLPVRLPGHFSVRGDWFLAVAGGSRSQRLGRRALDLFSSRRSNIRRMELGMGLPTRDVCDKLMFSQLPTALVKRDENGRTTAITYGELIGPGRREQENFRWFWRSQLRDYHRQSRLLQRWMGHMVAMWEDLRSQFGPDWRSGFELYDELEGKSFDQARSTLRRLVSWKDFKKLCELLEEQLKVGSRSVPRSETDEDWR